MSKLLKNLSLKGKAIRKDVLKMSYLSGSAHIGCSLSIVDLLTTLYFRILKINPQKPDWKNRDRFLLSKGHAAAALYATLAHRGFFSRKKLLTFCQDGGELCGHPEIDRVPGVEIMAGSLGHGLPMGVGMALAAKLDVSPFRIFVLLSDGECDEGSVWEAALSAAQFKLNNLIAIVDYNKFQALGKTNEILNLEPFIDKWRAFGWFAKEVDGHNFSQLLKVFEEISSGKNKPSVIIAHTIKGKGISFMENDFTWHYKNLDNKSYQKARGEINQRKV